LKFFDFFRDGQRKFASIRTPDDYLALKEYYDLSNKLQAKYYSLSRENKDRLDYGYFEGLEHWPSVSAPDDPSEHELFWNGWRSDIVDQPDEHAYELPSNPSFHESISSVFAATEIAFENIELYGVQKRVNWSVCAVTVLAQMAWQKRTGNEAPNTAHADVPGPFGLFLEEVLMELFNIYEIPASKVPSARSALRALLNVTNSETEFFGNW